MKDKAIPGVIRELVPRVHRQIEADREIRQIQRLLVLRDQYHIVCSMAEILADIDSAFVSDPAIDELGILMTATPPNLVLIEHKLGLSYEILKPLFSYSLVEFYALSRAVKKAERNLSDSVIADKMLRLTRAALLVKGDMPMLYNLRKTVLLENHTSQIIGDELAFLTVLFTKHPKSPSSWHHRRWCLKELYSCRQLESGNSVSDTANKLNLSATDLETELDICAKMSESYPKNYYSWMHRLWLTQFMNIAELESELNFTRTWLLSHTSDHSAANHRQQVIIKANALISVLLEQQKDQLDKNQFEMFQKLVSNMIEKKRIPRSCLLTQAESNDVESALSSCPEIGTTDENEDQNKIKNKTFCQFLFLENVFRESKEFVVLRPGSETLWSHMRATADLILTNVPRILNEKRKMKIPEFPQENIFQPPDSVFLISEEDFAIILNYSAVLENQQYIEEAEEKQKSENSSSDDSFQYLKKLTDLLNSEYVNNEEVNFLLLAWLIEWLKIENNFCQNSIDNFCAWNHGNHIRMSLRYYCFILSRIIVLYDINIFELDSNEVNNINNKNTNSRIVQYDAGEEYTENSEENIILKKIKKNDNATGEIDKTFHDCFSSFIVIVKKSLVAVSKQIQSEGERRWFNS